MDYSPWSERKIWPKLKVAISPKPKRLSPPNLVCMYVTSTPTCTNFFSRFYLNKFLTTTMDHWSIIHGPWSERKISPKSKIAISPNSEAHIYQNWCTCILHQPLLAKIFFSRFYLIKFFDHHGL